ncbi:hypothetical protein [Bradyrhizobium brasilense]|uniref:Uncharacterized protein n=1 Tax=Bradyrhizobium brasilense TaxID=1419277 RepID=A0A1G6VSW0_9BRAD|nr:hypothetical protein [Bradyrhizobium brasilense]MCC8976196.1 hypothetical protein [Bradyrhizobium brasilense]SDD56770.1 hypothetical protein SAMN05216337_1012174 [Bradyrhizobium brasilense]
MFEKLAKFRQVSPRRVVEPRRMPPPAAIHCNDNLPGFRRLAGRRRHPTPVCHWVLIDGRLECRWTVEDTGGDLDQQRRAAAKPRLCA